MQTLWIRQNVAITCFFKFHSVGVGRIIKNLCLLFYSILYKFTVNKILDCLFKTTSCNILKIITYIYKSESLEHTSSPMSVVVKKKRGYQSWHASVLFSHLFSMIRATQKLFIVLHCLTTLRQLWDCKQVYHLEYELHPSSCHWECSRRKHLKKRHEIWKTDERGWQWIFSVQLYLENGCTKMISEC